jgi:AraC family transcriptional activator of tynA and feaB
MMPMMIQSDDIPGVPQLVFEEWRALLRSMCGRYSPEAVEPKAFTGWARRRSVYGFVTMDLSCNAHRVVRTQRDVRLDGLDHYYAVFQVAGGSTLIQNDQAVTLAVGDAALVDSARPVTYVSDSSYGHFALQLPRRSLVSHLGFNPQPGLLKRGRTAAGRVLFDLVRDAGSDDASPVSRAESYLQLAVYDLVGALFAPSDPVPVSLHADKLFRRVCNIIKDRFADPDLGPFEVAAEAGISLRYLQTLFTAHNSSCSHFIQSVRLDHAARLVHRRQLLRTSQPLSEIAYACGFADYTNFARRFRRRFGHTPGSHSGEGA